MSDKSTTNKPINFIRHQINDDLDSGLHSSIQTRFPSGAEKLIQCEKQKGIALADAHITACNNLNSYQVEPSPIRRYIKINKDEFYGQ
jgi:hypothetical protein